jgi:hypothetical protein
VKRPSRTPSDLPHSIHQRLNMYALAATAGGVGMLAGTQASEAKIVYTPAHVVIGRDHKVALDLNHDGKNDFSFQETFITTTSVGEAHSLILSVLPSRKTNEIWGMGHHASALLAGIRVGPKGRFSYAKKTMAVDIYQDGTGGSGTCGGLWNNVKHRYLGFKFSIKGTTHFGWARLNVACITTFNKHQITGVLTGYAYETVPNKPIITGKTKGPDEIGNVDQAIPATRAVATPEPAALGLLAMGAGGLPLWRREESADAFFGVSIPFI